MTSRHIDLGAALLIALATQLLVFSVATFVRGDHAFDRLLLLGLRGPGTATPTGETGWLEMLSWQLTALGSPKGAVALTGIAALALALARRPAAALYVAVSVGTGATFGLLLKRLFETIRPHGLGAPGSEFATSFPSGHALLAALVATSLALVVRHRRQGTATKWAIAAALFALLFSLGVGLSRLYLGRHWPTDVVAGWVVGSGWAVAVQVLFRAGSRRLGAALDKDGIRPLQRLRRADHRSRELT